MNKKNYFIVLLFFVFCLSGCAISGGNRLYSGNPLPKGDVAFVVAVAGCYVMDVYVDREKERKYLHPSRDVASKMLELLPGEYVLGTIYSRITTYEKESGDKIRVKLKAQPGEIYVIYPRLGVPPPAGSANKKRSCGAGMQLL